MIKLINYIHKNYFKQLSKHTVSNMDLNEALDKGIFNKSFIKEYLNSSLEAFQHVWYTIKHDLANFGNHMFLKISFLFFQLKIFLFSER